MTLAQRIWLLVVMTVAAALLGLALAHWEMGGEGGALPGVTPQPMMHPPADWQGVQ